MAECYQSPLIELWGYFIYLFIFFNFKLGMGDSGPFPLRSTTDQSNVLRIFLGIWTGCQTNVYQTI